MLLRPNEKSDADRTETTRSVAAEQQATIEIIATAAGHPVYRLSVLVCEALMYENAVRMMVVYSTVSSFLARTVVVLCLFSSEQPRCGQRETT